MESASAAPDSVLDEPTEPTEPAEPTEPTVLTSQESAAPSQTPVEHEPPRPSVDLGCSAKKWDIFLNEWAKLASVGDLDDEQMAPQCRRCLTDSLKDAVTHVRGDTDKLEDKDLLDKVRSVAIGPPSTVQPVRRPIKSIDPPSAVRPSSTSIGTLRAVAHAAK